MINLGKSRYRIYEETKELVKAEIDKALETYLRTIEEIKNMSLEKEQFEEMIVNEFRKYLLKENEWLTRLQDSYQAYLEDSNR